MRGDAQRVVNKLSNKTLFVNEVLRAPQTMDSELSNKGNGLPHKLYQ